MQQTKSKPEYFNTDVSKILDNLTKYASKPLGFDVIFEDEKVLKKKGIYFKHVSFNFTLLIQIFFKLKRLNMHQAYRFR
jgi:hypothetical protein